MNTLTFSNSNSNANYLLNANNAINNLNTNNTTNIKNDLMQTLYNSEFKSTVSDEIQLNDNQLIQMLQLKQHELSMQPNSHQEDYAHHHIQNSQLIDLNNNNFDTLNLNTLNSLNDSNQQFINNLQSNINDKKLYELLNRVNLNQNSKQQHQVSLQDLQQQNHFDDNYLNNDSSSLLNFKLKLLQQHQLLQIQNLQNNNNLNLNTSNQNSLKYQFQLANESFNNLNKLKSINGYIDKNNMANNSNEDVLDNKYRQANANANQQDLIKKLLEKKKQQELNIINYQQQKQFQQLQSKILNQQYQQQVQQQQQYEPISKEYILSQLKAQKKLQAQIQQQKFQLQHQQQQNKQHQQMIETQNEINNNTRINLMHLLSMNSASPNDTNSKQVNNNNNNNNNNADESAFGAFNNNVSENFKAIENNQYLLQQQLLEKEHQQNQQQQQQYQKKQPKKLDPIEKLKQLLIENNNLNQQSSSRPSADKIFADSVTIRKELTSQHSLEKIENEIDEKKLNNQTISLNSLNEASRSQIINAKIEISSEGFIKNIPPNMLVDQYGMLGLTMMLNHKEKNNELDDNISFILGKGDLAKSLLQQSSDLLANNKDEQFESIFFGLIPNNENKEQRARKEDKGNQCDDKGGITYHLSPVSQKINPYELVVSGIRDKLPDINDLIKNSNDDLLFYLFYFVCKDDIQVKAFHLLSARNWIYNQELKIWIKTVKSKETSDTNEQQIINQHYMFDVEKWEIKKMN